MLLLFSLFSLSAICQSSDSPTIEEAKRQLLAMSSSTGKLGEACAKKGITGTFVVDITIQGKGQVLTVFMVSSSVEEIGMQNFLKNKLVEIEFENIKIPKKQRVKFRQSLTF